MLNGSISYLKQKTCQCLFFCLISHSKAFISSNIRDTKLSLPSRLSVCLSFCMTVYCISVFFFSDCLSFRLSDCLVSACQFFVLMTVRLYVFLSVCLSVFLLSVRRGGCLLRLYVFPSVYFCVYAIKKDAQKHILFFEFF